MDRRSSEDHEGPNPSFEELRVVRDLVEEAVGVLRYIARDPESVRRREQELRAFFTGKARMSEVFLALRPDRTAAEVAALLNIKRQNVDREIRALREEGLITPIHSGQRAGIWVRNPLLESALKLSRKVRSWVPEARIVDGPDASATAQANDPDDGQVDA